MNSRFSIAFCLYLLVLGTAAQNIPPKSALGIFLAPAPAGSGAAISVHSVVAGSTAESLGLKAADVLLGIDSLPIDDGTSFVNYLGEIAVGQIINLWIRRGEEEVQLNGPMLARQPIPVSPAAEAIWEEVPFRDGYIRAIIDKPKGEGPFPIIYFLQGYTCQSINWQNQQSPFVQVIRHWVEQGYAVLRVEKPGAGDFINCPDCKTLNFDDELEAFANGYELISRLPYLDAEAIVLYGHSLGGSVAPILASKYQPMGVITYGTAVQPWYDYLIRLTRYQHPILGGDIAESEEALKKMRPILYKLFVDNLSLAEAAPTNEEILFLQNYYALGSDGLFFDRELAFWQTLNQHNLAAYWQQTGGAVLSLYGGSDVEAIDEQDAKRIAQIVNAQNPGQGQFELIPYADHSLIAVPSKAEGIMMRSNGTYVSKYYAGPSPDFLTVVDRWLDSIQTSAGRSIEVISNNNNTPASYKEATPNIPVFITDPNTMDVATADLDSDGDLDLVLAMEGKANLVLFNNGEGKFEEHRVLAPKFAPSYTQLTGEDSEDVALVDFDLDGDLDLYFVSEDTDHHELFVNDGQGGFTPSSFDFPKSMPANAVAVYDFNLDGWPDILIGNRGQNEVFLNRQDGTFELTVDQFWPENEDHTQDLIVVDIDADGNPDIVEGVEQGGSNIYLWKDHSFVEMTDELFPDLTDYETRKLIAQDVNMDGRLDLFLCNVGWDQSRNPQNILLLQNEEGRFTDETEVWLPAEELTTLDAKFLDIDQDGLYELVTANGFGGHSIVTYKMEDQVFKKIELLPAIGISRNATAICLADWNGDGQEDIYLGNFQSGDQLLLSLKERE